VKVYVVKVIGDELMFTLTVIALSTADILESICQFENPLKSGEGVRRGNSGFPSGVPPTLSDSPSRSRGTLRVFPI